MSWVKWKNWVTLRTFVQQHEFKHKDEEDTHEFKLQFKGLDDTIWFKKGLREKKSLFSKKVTLTDMKNFLDKGLYVRLVPLLSG